jgi:hypothetical protein
MISGIAVMNTTNTVVALIREPDDGNIAHRRRHRVQHGITGSKTSPAPVGAEQDAQRQADQSCQHEAEPTRLA